MNVQKHLGMLGSEVVEKVTGFRGVVTSVSFDLYGCIQALVHPGLDKDGKLRDQSWFDVSRLDEIGSSSMERPNYEFGPIAEGRHGAEEKPQFNKS